MSDRIWFITGASRGFGRSFTQAALAAGDRVAVAQPAEHEDGVGLALHEPDAAEVALELVELAAQEEGLLLRHGGEVGRVHLALVIASLVGRCPMTASCRVWDTAGMALLWRRAGFVPQ